MYGQFSITCIIMFMGEKLFLSHNWFSLSYEASSTSNSRLTFSEISSKNRNNDNGQMVFVVTMFVIF
jgi:hypothetical protein